DRSGQPLRVVLLRLAARRLHSRDWEQTRDVDGSARGPGGRHGRRAHRRFLTVDEGHRLSLAQPHWCRRRRDCRPRRVGYFTVGAGPNTSSTVMILIGPRLSALIPGSIAARSPAITTANFPGRMYFCATRWTSAAVTASIFCT